MILKQKIKKDFEQKYWCFPHRAPQNFNSRLKNDRETKKSNEHTNLNGGTSPDVKSIKDDNFIKNNSMYVLPKLLAISV